MAKTKTPVSGRGSSSASSRTQRSTKKSPQRGKGSWLPWAAALVLVAIAVFALRPDASEAPAPGVAVSDPVVGGDLHSLVVDPSDPETIYVGSHQGVSVSTDAGGTWETIETLVGADAMGWAFTDEGIYVGGHPGLSVSTDAGQTFETRNEGLPNTDLHAMGAGGGVIYAASPAAGLIASTDGGQSWEVRSQEAGGAFMGKLLVDPQDPDHLIGPDMQAGATESNDGGRTWEVLGGVQGATWVSWNPTDTKDIVVTSPGSAARSGDGGKTWETIEIPEGASIVEFSSDAQTLFAAVLEAPDARIWMSTDAGQSWEET